MASRANSPAPRWVSSAAIVLALQWRCLDSSQTRCVTKSDLEHVARQNGTLDYEGGVSNQQRDRSRATGWAIHAHATGFRNPFISLAVSESGFRRSPSQKHENTRFFSTLPTGRPRPLTTLRPGRRAVACQGRPGDDTRTHNGPSYDTPWENKHRKIRADAASFRNQV
jgi:hypothetical protein